MKVTLRRLNENFFLEGKNEDGNTIFMDNSLTGGGTGAAVRPMEVMLMSLAGCSSMDVLSILKKGRLNPTNYSVEVNAERAEGVPSVLTKVVIEYRIEGDIEADKALRAIDLSMEKYCSISIMLRPKVEIVPVLRLNGEIVK